MQNVYLKFIFHVCKIRAQGVFWKSFYKEDIHPEIQVAPRGGGGGGTQVKGIQEICSPYKSFLWEIHKHGSHFLQKDSQGKYSATSIDQIAIHLFILGMCKCSCDGGVIENLVYGRFGQWEQLMPVIRGCLY